MHDTEPFDLMTTILLREHLIHRGQALGLAAEKRALRKQGRIVPTCELALAFRYITAEQAEAAARLYARLACKAGPGRSKPLGLRLLEAGLVTPTRLLSALERQRVEGGRLGRILVRLGWLNPLQLQMFLALQLNDGHPIAA